MITPSYSPSEMRYDHGMKYRRCGRSGVLLPEIPDGQPCQWHSADSRIARDTTLKRETLTADMQARIKALNEIAARRGQTLAEMSLAWLLKDELVTSVIIGASSVAQLEDNLKAVTNTSFGTEELEEIQRILL